MSDIYRFLAECNLSNPNRIAETIRKFSEHRLNRFCERYIRFARKQSFQLPSGVGMTDIYPDVSNSSLPLPLIKQLSVYTRTIYIHDPLLQLAEKWLTKGFGNTYIYFKTDQKMEDFKRELYFTVEYILELRPLIEAKIVVLIALAIPASNKDGSIYMSEFYTPEGRFDQPVQENLFPQSIVTYANQHLRAYHGRLERGHILPIAEKPIDLKASNLYTSDKICFQFQEDEIYWNFHFTSHMDINEDGYINMGFKLENDVPIQEDLFRPWVEDKRNYVIASRVNNLLTDIVYTTKLGAKFLTNSRVSKDLALSQISEDTTTSGQVLNALMSLELPYFQDASLKSIAKARQNEVSFLNFISAMDAAFNQIKILPTDANYAYEIEQIKRDLLYKPIREIEDQMKSLEHTLFRDSGIYHIGTLMLVGFLAATTLYAEAVVAALSDLPLQLSLLGKRSEGFEKIKQHPGFFYWDVTQSK